MAAVLPFDTGDAQTGAGQLPQDFAKFFSGTGHVAFVARAMPARLSDKRLRKDANLAAAAAPCSSLNFAHMSRSDY